MLHTINLRVGEKLEQFLSTPSGVKQGDSLALILFLFVIHAVVYPTHSTKNWEFEIIPDFRWYPDTQDGTPQRQLRATKHINKGPKSFSLSAFRADYRLHTGVESKNEGSKTEAIHFPRPGQESSPADTEDIDMDEERFASSSST
jgi:hypothetical protein